MKKDWVTKIDKIKNKIIEEPIVPKFNPPFSDDFVSRSPKVAPNGLVKTNASQNNNMCEILEKK